MTDTITVALIVASVRRERVADALLPWLRGRLAERPGLDTDLVDLRDLGPADLPGHGLRPGGTSDVLGSRLDRADAFLVLTPEYNHSFPAALKNVVDWHYTEWARKPVAFVSYGAASGGARAVEALRPVFSELRATTTRDAVHLVAPWERLDGRRFVPSGREDAALDATLDELRWWASALRTARLADAVAA